MHLLLHDEAVLLDSRFSGWGLPEAGPVAPGSSVALRRGAGPWRAPACPARRWVSLPLSRGGAARALARAAEHRWGESVMCRHSGLLPWVCSPQALTEVLFSSSCMCQLCCELKFGGKRDKVSITLASWIVLNCALHSTGVEVLNSKAPEYFKRTNNQTFELVGPCKLIIWLLCFFCWK